MIDRSRISDNTAAPIRVGANATSQTGISRFAWIGGTQLQPHSNFSCGAGFLFMTPEYQRQWRQKNLEHVRAYQREYQSSPKWKRYAKKWAENNRKKSNARSKRWRAKNKVHRADYAIRYRLANVNRLRRQARDRYRKNRARVIEREAARRAQCPPNPFVEDLIAALQKRKRIRCYYCKRLVSRYHLDHITPLAKGGLHEVANLVAACQFCNQSKGATPVNGWRRNKQLILL